MAIVDRAPLLTRAAPRDEEDATQRPLDVRSIARLFRYTQPHAAKRNWLVLLVMVRSIQLPALIWVLAAVIEGPVARGDFAGVARGVAGFLTLAAFTQVVMHFRQRLALELGESVVHDLRRDMFAHLQCMPMSFFARTKLGRAISRMTSDVENVRVGVQEVLFVSLVQAGQMAVAGVFMLWYNPRLFSIVLGMAPVLWAIDRRFRRRLSRSLRDVQESFGRLTANLAESVNGIRVTQSYARQETNARMFADLAADHGGYNMEVSRAQGLFLPLLDLTGQTFTALLLLAGGWLVLSPGGGADVGDLVGFFFMATMFFAPIVNLGTQYHQALTAMAGAERIFRLLDTPPEWSDDASASPLPRISGRVEFRDVSFGYLPDRLVLRDVSFVAEPGQTVALVGHTGSGKSTVASLVARFYLPARGQVLVDGVDLATVQTRSLRSQLGMVLQQSFLFDGTVRENIRFGRPEASDGQILEAARRLDCLDLLLNLPGGLDAPAGERGSRLSLGQRQLVCFVRAMLADPRILILDEATGNVDAMTEARLQHALSRLLRGRTSLAIAHRLSTIRHADLVLVLDQGEIVERGTHAELLARGGVYSRLYEKFVQASAA